MNKKDLIIKIRNADSDELDMAATLFSKSLQNPFAMNNLKNPFSADFDLGEIGIELCARKKELVESKSIGEEYRKRMLTQHFATAEEFLNLSVEEGILSADDAEEIRINPSQALQRLCRIENKIDMQWVMKYSTRLLKERN